MVRLMMIGLDVLLIIALGFFDASSVFAAFASLVAIVCFESLIAIASIGAMVIVSNGRNEETTVTLTIDGADDTFVVPADVLYERHVALAEAEAYDISLSSGNAVLGAASGTFDCENPEVRAKTKKKEPEELTELPRTGAANTAMLATAGAALVATGLVALRASAIRRERLVELRAD